MDFRVFSPDGLLEALNEAGYRVGKRTINRWKKEGSATAEDIRAIQQILFPNMEKEAAPSVTRRLLTGIIALEQRAHISDAELAAAAKKAEVLEARAQAVDARLGRTLVPPPRKRAAPPQPPDDGRADGSPSSKRPSRKRASQE